MNKLINFRRAILAAACLGAVAPAAAPAENAPNSGQAELARQILADQTLSDVHRMAKELLRGGFNAGSGYGEVWIRDLNTFIEVSLEVNPPARLREALLPFFKLQGTNGDIVDGYIPLDQAKVKYAYRTSPLTPNLMAHKNTVETDQESSLVQAIRKYVSVTGDRTLLQERIAGVTVLDRLGLALQYVLIERFDREHGLVWGATTADWGDVQPESPWGVALDADSHRALDIYDNAMLVIALNDYLQLLPADAPEAARWTTTRDALKQNIRKHLWDASRHKFIPHVYLAGSPFPKEFDENAIYYHGGTAVAIEAGLLTREEVGRSLDQMVANVRAAGAASIGLTVYPPYPEGFFKNPGMRSPYSYQNGGDWCWFGGRMIQALIKEGKIAEAFRELRPMTDRVKRTGGFHEWWSRDNQPRGSGEFRGSAGVLGRAIEMLQGWARQSDGPGSDAPIRGEVILNRGSSAWESQQVQEPCILPNPKDPTRLVMFYSGVPATNRNLCFIGKAWALKADPFTWRQDESNPVFGPGKQGWDSGSIRLDAVLYIPEEEAYYIYYSGATGAVQDRIGLAICPVGEDGYAGIAPGTIQRLGAQPVLSPEPAAPYFEEMASQAAVLREWDATERRWDWFMYYSYRGKDGILPGLRLATSRDGKTWTRHYNEKDPRGMGQIFKSTPGAYYEWHQAFKIGGTYLLSIEVGVSAGKRWRPVIAASQRAGAGWSQMDADELLQTKWTGLYRDETIYHVATPAMYEIDGKWYLYAQACPLPENANYIDGHWDLWCFTCQHRIATLPGCESIYIPGQSTAGSISR